MITSASPPFLNLLRLQKEVGPIANPLKPVADVAGPGSDERRTTAENPEGGKAPAEKVKAVGTFERKADSNQQNKREDPKKAGKEADNEPKNAHDELANGGERRRLFERIRSVSKLVILRLGTVSILLTLMLGLLKLVDKFLGFRSRWWPHSEIRKLLLEENYVSLNMVQHPLIEDLLPRDECTEVFRQIPAFLAFDRGILVGEVVPDFAKLVPFLIE
jgi:hypothetical protein